MSVNILNERFNDSKTMKTFINKENLKVAINKLVGHFDGRFDYIYCQNNEGRYYAIFVLTGKAQIYAAGLARKGYAVVG